MLGKIRPRNSMIPMEIGDQGRRSNGSTMRVVTDGRTDGRTLPRFAVDNYSFSVHFQVEPA